MSLVLIVSATLMLGIPVTIGTAMQDGIMNQRVPFTIDDRETEGATIISTGLFGEIPLNGAVSGSFVLPNGLSADNPVISVDLSGPERGLIATDVLVWGHKETLFFDAGNTARAEVMLGLLDFGATTNQLVRAYKKISDHPKFGQLEQLVLEEKGWPENEALLERIADLTVKIAIDILKRLRDI